MGRWLAGLLLFIGALVAAPEVRANYTEAHVAGVDVRAVVARDGTMTVTHVIAYRVLAGFLKTIAVSGFGDDFRLRPTATITSSDGHVVSGSVSRDDKGNVHVTVDDPKGVKRGDYKFELAYEGSLSLTRDGAFDRVRFAMPAMREGIDGARLVLDLPSAPTEPRALTEGDVAADLETLRRTADRDELELVRPHVPKSEAAVFFARVDPKALALVADPSLRAPAVAPVVNEPITNRPSLAIAILVAACALALFVAALAKAHVVRSMRTLVGLRPAVAAGLAAVLFGAGVLVEAQARFTLGAVLVACAMPLLAWRAIREAEKPRARGAWLVIKPEEAFASQRARADFLDATTPRGLVVLAAVFACVAIACRFARGADGAAPYIVAIDALVLVPIFFTGTSRQMPPSAAREGAALAPIARALSGFEELRVAPLVSGDALRLLVSPRLAMAGVGAIEVGVAWERAGGAMLPSFDVIVRVHDASFAAAKMTAAFPDGVLPGRKPDERVYRFEPEGPSVSAAATSVLELSDLLRDRRFVMATHSAATERRVPNARSQKGVSLA